LQTGSPLSGRRAMLRRAVLEVLSELCTADLGELVEELWRRGTPATVDEVDRVLCELAEEGLVEYRVALRPPPLPDDPDYADAVLDHEWSRVDAEDEMVEKRASLGRCRATRPASGA